MEFDKLTTSLEDLHMKLTALDCITSTYTLKDFEILKQFDVDVYNKSYLAKEVSTGKQFLLKVFTKSKFLNYGLLDGFIGEVEILVRLQHENIHSFIDFFWNEENIYVVLDGEVEKDVYREFEACKRFNERRAVRYLRQVISAVQYCHGMHIVHRDIKPENLLLTADDIIKLAGFGIAAYSPDDRFTGRNGAPLYLAPEVISEEEYGLEVDNWSIGILAYEFVTGQAPFPAKSVEGWFKYLREYDNQLQFPPHVSDLAQDFIRKLLVANPQERMSLRDAMEHPWIKEYEE